MESGQSKEDNRERFKRAAIGIINDVYFAGTSKWIERNTPQGKGKADYTIAEGTAGSSSTMKPTRQTHYLANIGQHAVGTKVKTRRPADGDLKRWLNNKKKGDTQNRSGDIEQPGQGQMWQRRHHRDEEPKDRSGPAMSSGERVNCSKGINPRGHGEQKEHTDIVRRSYGRMRRKDRRGIGLRIPSTEKLQGTSGRVRHGISDSKREKAKETIEISQRHRYGEPKMLLPWAITSTEEVMNMRIRKSRKSLERKQRMNKWQH
ncbi:hypothetical protein GQ43DRAFT_499402 [Delitschia confertaspora ATCC 74209]|uniref:Uncharacterized protein n=1 Tax=Delitschia confertaspora ATCC 74209 TaxID=1513339 RepID=A0A9P4JQ77_9PLEO|nr:hypothetical protein GQ43DRAFT_499402 [Delitschia confertaspora ATCC 74209]